MSMERPKEHTAPSKKNGSFELVDVYPSPRLYGIDDVVTLNFQTDYRTVQIDDNDKYLPFVDARFDTSNEGNTIKAAVEPGMYGLSLSADPIEYKTWKKAENIVNKWSTYAEKLLKEDSFTAPIIFQTKNGLTYRDNPSSEARILLIPANEDEGVGWDRVRYLGSDDETIGTYVPNEGDCLLIAAADMLEQIRAASNVEEKYDEIISNGDEPTFMYVGVGSRVAKSMQAGAQKRASLAERKSVQDEESGREQDQILANIGRRQSKEKNQKEPNTIIVSDGSTEGTHVRKQNVDVASGDQSSDRIDSEEVRSEHDAKRGFTVTDRRTSSKLVPGKELELYRGAGETGDGSNTQASGDSVVRDMIRVAGSVEKYSGKVATYEAIAAQALAKRMKGKLFKSVRRSTKEADIQYEDTMRFLDRYTMALDNSMMKQWALEGRDDEEIAQLLEEQQQIRAEQRAAQNREELTKGKLASWLDKYANLSTKKKVALSIGAGAVALTAGAALATVGGAAAVTGGVVLTATKVGKTYFQQRSKIYSKDAAKDVPKAKAYTVDSSGEVVKRTGSARQQIISAKDTVQATRESAIKDADRNKKIAVGLAGVSALLIGGGIATKAVEHGDDVRSWFENQKDANISDTKVTVPSDAPMQIDSLEMPQIPAPEPNIESSADFSVDASTVVAGEGWYQTFTELGIPASEQPALLQKIGPALQEQGWAYPMADGTWGISRPGTLPSNVLELVQNSR